MQAFIAALHIDYDSLFTCPLCTEDDCTIIIDGKAMEVNRKPSRFTDAAWQTPLMLSESTGQWLWLLSLLVQTLVTYHRS